MIPVFLSATDDILVNSTTAGDQENAAIAAIAGGFGIVWTNSPSSGVSRIFAQQFDLMGGPDTLDGEQEIVSGGDTEGRDNAAVAVQADGLATVVYDDLFPVGPGLNTVDLIGAQISLDGSDQYSEIYPAVFPEFDERNARLSPMGASDTAIVFEAEGSGVRSALLGRIDPNGAVAGAITLRAQQSNDAAKPDVAELNGGQFVAVWLEGVGTSLAGATVYAGLYEYDTINEFFVQLATPVQVTSGTGSGDASEVRVVALSGGGFAIGWIEGSNAFVQSFPSTLALPQPVLQIGSNLTVGQANIDLVGTPDGGFVAVWDEPQPGEFRNILAQRFDVNGVAFGAPEVVNQTVAGGQRDAEVTVLEDGKIAVAWESDGPDGDGWGIYTRLFEAQNFLTTGDDSVSGDGSNEQINGIAGNDTILGQGGDDTIGGGEGDDSLEGNRGSDTLAGGAGNDTLFGVRGGDALFGDDGDDRMSGGQGFDLASGGDGNDTIRGGNGDDTVEGGNGNDRLFGGRKADLIDGGDGDDFITAQQNDDTVTGGEGNDDIEGGSGRDSIDGGDGDDTIDAGTWKDTITGGDGADTFVLRPNYDRDEITDFTDDVDTLLLDTRLWTGNLTPQEIVDTFGGFIGPDVVLDFGQEEFVLLGVTDRNTLVDDIAFL